MTCYAAPVATTDLTATRRQLSTTLRSTDSEFARESVASLPPFLHTSTLGGGHSHRRAARDAADSSEIRCEYLVLAIAPCHVCAAPRAHFVPRLRIRREAVSGACHLVQVRYRMTEPFAPGDIIGVEE